MKMVISALLALALTSSSMFAADGEVVKVFTQEFSKPVVEAKLGDLLVFSVQGGTFPGGMVQDLKVEVKGDSLSKVGVWLVPVVTPDGQRAVGGIDMSAFLKTAKIGEATVTITPQGELNDKLKKPMTFKVKVTKPES